MLKIEKLTKVFDGFTAVDGISLTINRGELFGFLGPNGAGKTTTIKMLVGLLSPTSGALYVDGLDVWKKPMEVKRKIGYVPDQPFLYDKLTGREFLAFSGGLYELSKKEIKLKVDELVNELAIEDWLYKRTEEYSQGMRQRITIASAFLHNPDLIVIDEPMVGLDPQTAHLVKKFLRKNTEAGKTVFMSTHSLNVVEEICTKVSIIKRGQIIFDDKIEVLEKLKQEKNNNLEELFIQLTNEE